MKGAQPLKGFNKQVLTSPPRPHPSTDLLQERDKHIERLKTQLKETVDKGESFRNKLHAAIKKGKSIEAERNELRARLEQSPAGSVSGDAPGPGSDAPSTPTASTEELDALRMQLDDANLSLRWQLDGARRGRDAELLFDDGMETRPGDIVYRR